jgi:hypothetical protein
MNEKIIFRRNAFNGLIYLIAAVFFAFNGSFMIINIPDNLSGYGLLLAALIFFMNAVWAFRTPFAVIEKDHLIVNVAALNKKTAYLPFVKKINEISKNKIDLFLENGREVNLNLSGMQASDKEDFLAVLRRLVP